LPLNLIETIQALVLYNRTGSFNNTTIGLAIELYNSTQDPTLTEILANIRVITTAVDVYRFDFPDIATYTGFATGESLNNIIREEDATSEVVIVAESPTEMVGGLMVDTITLPTIGDVETAIQGKQNELTAGANITIEGDEISCDLTAGTNIDITDGVISTTGLATTTQLGTKQDEIDNTTDLNVNTLTTEGKITCGGIIIDPNRPCFCAYASSNFVSSRPQTLEYNDEFFDTTNSYDTTTYEYTIPITGNSFFYYSFVWVGESGCVVRLDKNNIQQDRVILKVDADNN
jgi:hypothetical protein